MENNKKVYEELEIKINEFLIQCDEYDPSETNGEPWIDPDNPII